ncbi:hypothetical protein OE88DRAFT_349914 [Heliocybe sulcata]|uniref:Uncharacterized protein n=1 Tax=Heliocybe sulcata TaxID=5364 RepID=A0A5C3MX54_9AGAM|nr:hypothetical protein OE88DRAFT_349914 [Heliocybe sulcata]
MPHPSRRGSAPSAWWLEKEVAVCSRPCGNLRLTAPADIKHSLILFGSHSRQNDVFCQESHVAAPHLQPGSSLERGQQVLTTLLLYSKDGLRKRPYALFCTTAYLRQSFFNTYVSAMPYLVHANGGELAYQTSPIFTSVLCLPAARTNLRSPFPSPAIGRIGVEMEHAFEMLS